MAEQDREHAELLERVNREMALFGHVTTETAEALSYAQTGIRNFRGKMDAATGAVGALAEAFGAYNKAVYKGEHGAKAFSDATDKMTEAAKYAAVALTLLTPGGVVMKAVVGALGFFTVKLIEAAGETTKAVGEQYDQVTDAFKGIAKVGAAAGDGLQGVFDSMMKLGYGTERASEYIKLMSENAESFALFGGTVAQGRKQFEQTVQSMKPFRDQLSVLGVPPKEQSEAIAAYVRQQRLMTMGTKAQMDLSSEAVLRYVKETDLLTRITGANRQEQEKLLEDAMGEDVFQSMIYELEQQGVEGQQKAARLRESVVLAEKTGGKEFARGIRDSLSGFIGVSGESQKVFRATNGAVVDYRDSLVNQNLTQEQAIEAFRKLAKATGENYDAQIQGAQQLGKGAEVFGSTNFLKVKQFGENAASGAALLAKAEQTAQERDELLNKRAVLEREQLDTQIAQQKLVNIGLKTYATVTASAATANRQMAEAALKAAQALGKIAGSEPDSVDYGKDYDSAGTPDTKAIAASGGLAGQKDEYDRIKKLPEYERTLAEIARYEKVFNEGNKLNEKQLKGFAERSKIAAQAVLDYQNSVGRAAPAAGGGGGGGGRAPAAPAGGGSSAGGSAPAAPAAATPAVPSGGTAPAAPSGGPAPDYNQEGQNTGGGAQEPKKRSGGDGVQGSPRKSTEAAIFHHTGGRSLSGAVSTLQARGLAYHYMIDRDGKIVPFMADNAVAYHAGPTDKNPKVGNWNTLGIAAVANNNEDVTKEQMAAAIKLNQDLSGKFGYGSQNVFGHGQVTSRKGADEGTALVNAIRSGVKDTNPQAQHGGIFSGPMSGYPVTMHGNEAVIPLKNGAVPVSLDGGGRIEQIQAEFENMKRNLMTRDQDAAPGLEKIAKEFKQAFGENMESGMGQSLKDLVDQNSALISMMTQMVQTQKETNNIQTKMLRVAQN